VAFWLVGFRVLRAPRLPSHSIIQTHAQHQFQQIWLTNGTPHPAATKAKPPGDPKLTFSAV